MKAIQGGSEAGSKVQKRAWCKQRGTSQKEDVKKKGLKSSEPTLITQVHLMLGIGGIEGDGRAKALLRGFESPLKTAPMTGRLLLPALTLFPRQCH